MDAAIRAVELTKHYDLYTRPADRIIEAITRRPRHTVFPALQDVSFEVERGETVGIIGRNGAGKSTLLKLLCGVTRPSSGSIDVEGSVASILELGTGFHPEFTGRDNAALNAAILGLSPDEVRRTLPSILEFSELGDFLDRPVKTYSSGMYMRLAFSVAVNVNPDVLVIDEALAVGDGHFQKKCVDKIREFQQERKTILFCSHALYLVSTICRRTLWLDRGTVMRWGPTLDVVHEYESFLLQQDREHPATESDSQRERTATPVRIADISICDGRGAARDRFRSGEDVTIKLRIQSDDPSLPIHSIIGIHRAADDLQCFAVGTHADGIEPLRGRTEYELSVALRDVPLNRGEYTIIAFVGDENALAVFDRKDVPSAFSIQAERFDIGLITVEHQWTTDRVEAAVAR